MDAFRVIPREIIVIEGRSVGAAWEKGLPLASL